MGAQNNNIIIIGPVGAGKSTQGKLLAKALNKQSVSLDRIAERYYQANGFGNSRFEKARDENGFLFAYRQWWPSLAYAAQQVVKDYTDCVIDFGAGHSHYEDELMYKGVKEALAGCRNIILLLPTKDLDQSVSLLKQQSINQRNMDWIFSGYDFIEHWVKDYCNSDLATVTLFTDDKTPEQTCEEILKAIGGSRAPAADVESKGSRVSDIDLHDLEKRMSSVLLTVANAHFEGDYETFQTHHDPIVPEEEFQQVASSLKSFGKPVDVRYLGHIDKLERVKLLWKVTYSDSKEELLWQFNIELDGIGERIESMGIN